MDEEDLIAAGDVWAVNGDVTIETTRAKEGGVEDVRSISACKNNNVLCRSKAIHLNQKLIESRLALVVSSKLTALATRLADGINLIDKDDAWGVLLCGCEEVSYTGSTNTYEHLNEFGTGDREERNRRFSCCGFGKEGLSCPWRSREDGTTGNFGSEFLIFCRFLQELNKFHNLLLRFIHTSDVLESYAHFVFLVEEFRPTFANAEDPS